jgi:inner membrane protein
MMASTHIAFGLFSTTGLFSLFSLSLHRDLPAAGAAILGSLLPDLDTPNSAVGRLLPFVSAPVERRWGHRTVTHCLLAVGALGVVSAPLVFYRGTVYAALLVGYLSHLLADCATKSGVPLFHPHPTQCVLPGNSRYRVTTGSLAERGLLLGLLLLLGLIFPLSNMGGVWKAVRYLMATQATAYSDYREATTEAVLDFKGHWRTSRQPVEGQALLLEGTKTTFLIAYQGQVWEYGESGDILPDRSRVRATGRPVRWDTLTVEGKPFGQVVAQVPPAAFVSGRLESAKPFVTRQPEELSSGQHESVKRTAQRLELAYASRDRLERLEPVHRPAPEQLQQLQQRLTDGQQALASLQLQRPPVHYLRLREAEEALQVLRQKQASLQDSTVVFTGTLFVRQPGGTAP